MRINRSINYFRRTIGIILCFAPVFVLSASIAYGLAHRGALKPAGLVFVALGAIIGALNFYLSFIRPYLYWRKRNLTEPYRHISGFPVVGSLLAFAGGVVSFGSEPIALFALITIILDTGSPIRFLIVTWHDSSLWDE